MTLASELQDVCSESCGQDSCACIICRAAYELERRGEMVKSFDETLADAKRAVDTVKAWTASERHQYELGRAAGRAEGIREAMAAISADEREARYLSEPTMSAVQVESLSSRWRRLLESFLTAPPPPAATPECTCRVVLTYPDALHVDCPVHAPEPAAEKKP